VRVGFVWGLGGARFPFNTCMTVCVAGLWAWWGFRCRLGFESVVLCSLPVCWSGVGWSLSPVSCRPGAVCGLLYTLIGVVVCVGDACLLLVRSDSHVDP
jgi:hypothetical protein